MTNHWQDDTTQNMGFTINHYIMNCYPKLSVRLSPPRVLDFSDGTENLGLTV